MKKIAISQSNYIPWKGYFDMIAAVDEFILYDDMQFTRRDWRNRNLIKTPHGVQWLTVPICTKGKYEQKIKDTKIHDPEWAKAHWRALKLNYCRAPYFNEIASWLEPLYLNHKYTHITQLNRIFIEAICKYLSIKTVITSSSDYSLIDGKSERLVDLCLKASGTEYISGPSAEDYLDTMIFSNHGIKLTWFNYSGYSSYSQLWGGFIHEVTILDLLFNCGKESPMHMKYIS
jgi:hypothetical protein